MTSLQSTYHLDLKSQSPNFEDITGMSPNSKFPTKAKEIAVTSHHKSGTPFNLKNLKISPVLKVNPMNGKNEHPNSLYHGNPVHCFKFSIKAFCIHCIFLSQIVHLAVLMSSWIICQTWQNQRFYSSKKSYHQWGLVTGSRV